jgi:hypothetical protein
MRIEFRGKTNKDYCMVNTAQFKLPNGSIVTIDRDETIYAIVDDTLNMEWEGCYLWAISDYYIFDQPAYLNNTEAIELFKSATLIYLELEDDADDDYEITDIEFSVS